jgi:hypothetical protein
LINQTIQLSDGSLVTVLKSSYIYFENDVISTQTKNFLLSDFTSFEVAKLTPAFQKASRIPLFGTIWNLFATMVAKEQAMDNPMSIFIMKSDSHNHAFIVPERDVINLITAIRSLDPKIEIYIETKALALNY